MPPLIWLPTVPYQPSQEQAQHPADPGAGNRLSIPLQWGHPAGSQPVPSVPGTERWVRGGQECVGGFQPLVVWGQVFEGLPWGAGKGTSEGRDQGCSRDTPEMLQGCRTPAWG